MSAQGIPLKLDFRERARVNDVPVARLIGFEAKEIANGRATVILAAGPQHANPMGTLECVKDYMAFSCGEFNWQRRPLYAFDVTMQSQSL